MEIRSQKIEFPGARRKGRYQARETAVAVSSLLMVLVLVSFFIIYNFAPAVAAEGTDTGSEVSIIETTEDPTVYITEITVPEVTEELVIPDPPRYVPISNNAKDIGGVVGSPYTILVDMERLEAVAEHLPDERMYPASMTKVMTLILVCELIPDFRGEFCVTENIVNEVAAGNGSNVGLVSGEVVKVRDLVYSMMLPSACDSAKCLAAFISGSEEAFAELMNRKAGEIGMTGTHFSNASGMHSVNNYSTARDMATMMAYAYENELARQVMSTESYTMSATEKHAARRIRSTVFRLDDTYTGERSMGDMRLVCGKTGTANAAGRCLVSVATSPDGKSYILVTGGATSTRQLVDDTYYIYSNLCG